MQIDLAAGYGFWFELAVVLGVGTAVMVGLAASAAALVGSAVWKRTIWQAATLGLLALVLVELTGTGPALVRLVPWKSETAPPEARLTPTTTVDRLSEMAVAFHRPEPLQPPTESIATDWAGETDLDWPSEFESEEDVASPKPLPVQGTKPAQEPAVEADTVVTAPPSPVWWPGVIWVLGALAVTGRAVFTRLMLLVFRRRHARSADEALCRRVDVLARRLGIRRGVCVLEVVGLKTPVAFGCLRPTIALPDRFSKDFDRRQQEAVLAHELAHLAACDPGWQLLGDLLCATLWWHPLVWWLRQRFRSAGETLADEASLLVPDGPDVLADCLVAMGRHLTGRRQLGWLSIEGSGFRSSLGRRVERLLSLSERKWRTPQRRRLVLAKTVLPVSLVILAVLCTAWVRPQANLTKGGTTMNVLSNSWRNSLAAMALVALMSPASGDALPAPQPREAEEVERREAEEARHHEGKEAERHIDELRHEFGELQERAQHIERELDGRKPDADDEAHGLHRELGEIRERMEHIERGIHEVEREHHEAEEHGQRERAEHFEELKREAHELEERGHKIKRELGDRGPDDDDEAHALHAKLREIDGRMKHIRREVAVVEQKKLERRAHQLKEMEVHAREKIQERRKLHERAKEIRHELEELGDRAPDRSERLQAELREIHEAAGRLEREIAEIKQAHSKLAGPPPEGKERLQRRLEELKHQIARLSEAGRHDEAERLEREGHELLERFKAQQKGHRPEPRPEGDLERRVHHVKVAIENLRAAGLPEAAERLEQDLKRKLAEHGHRGPPPPEHRDGPPRPEGPQQMVHQLQDQVHQLRREVEQLRGLLKELTEQRRR